MQEAQQARNGQTQIPFSLTVLEPKDSRAGTTPASHNLSVAERILRPNEVNLSGAQVLLGLAVVLCSIGSFYWVVVKLWLFGR